MSFDINPSRNLSNIQASSKTTDGGAGNTGYFQRGSEENKDLLNFAKDYPADSFEKIELPEESEEDKGFLDLLKDFLKLIWNFIKSILVKPAKK